MHQIESRVTFTSHLIDRDRDEQFYRLQFNFRRQITSNAAKLFWQTLAIIYYVFLLCLVRIVIRKLWVYYDVIRYQTKNLH